MEAEARGPPRLKLPPRPKLPRGQSCRRAKLPPKKAAAGAAAQAAAAEAELRRRSGKRRGGGSGQPKTWPPRLQLTPGVRPGGG